MNGDVLMKKPAEHEKAVADRRPHHPPKQAPRHQRRLPVLQVERGGGVGWVSARRIYKE